MKNKKFDFLVIGGGLSGWLVAQALSKRSYSVGLVEGTSHSGGLTRGHNSPIGMLEHGLKILPNCEDTLSAIKFLEDVSGLTLNPEVEECAPIAYEKGAFVPFVGFGDNPPAEVEEVSYYTAASRIRISRPFYEVIQTLESAAGVHHQTKSQVTRFNCENGIIQSVRINGDKTIEAERYVFCGNPQDFPHLVPEGTLQPRFIQKISRAKSWTSVALYLVHSKPVTDNLSMHVLMGGGENAHVCLGAFHQPNERGEQLSQWLSFLPSDLADEELAASSLREIKRQIKRPYPNALEKLAWERILVSPRSHGQILAKEDKDGCVPGLENLWLASGFLHSSKNLVGTIRRAEQIIQHFDDQKSAETSAERSISQTEASPAL